MNFRFELRSASAEQSQIVLVIVHNGERKKISTKITVPSKYWNQEEQSISRKWEKYPSASLHFSRWVMAATAACDKYYYLDEVVKELKKTFNIKYDDRQANDFLKWYLKWASTSTPWKKVTSVGMRTYKLMYHYVTQVLKPKRNLLLTDISRTFLLDYYSWLRDYKQYSVNTADLHMKNLKAALNEASRQHMDMNYDYETIRRVRESVDNIYLTEEEIKKISETELSAEMNRVRDLFLLGYYTAQRFSDYSRITRADIRNDNCIHIRQLKTDALVVIPVHPTVSDILNKYGGTIPSISQQRFNEYIKIVARRAGITESITLRRNGKMMTYQKWELVTSHTARRSAATNMYLAGISTLAIMKITGHSSIKNLLTYIKVDELTNAQTLSSHPFFNK